MNRHITAIASNSLPDDGTYKSEPRMPGRRRGHSCKARAQRPGNRSDHLTWPGARKLMARA